MSHLKPSRKLHSAIGESQRKMAVRLCMPEYTIKELKHWPRRTVSMAIRREKTLSKPYCYVSSFPWARTRNTCKYFPAKQLYINLTHLILSEETHLNTQKQTTYYLLCNLLFIESYLAFMMDDFWVLPHILMLKVYFLHASSVNSFPYMRSDYKKMTYHMGCVFFNWKANKLSSFISPKP